MRTLTNPTRTPEQTARVELIKAINAETESTDMQVRHQRWHRAVGGDAMTTQQLEDALGHLRAARALLAAAGAAR